MNPLKRPNSATVCEHIFHPSAVAVVKVARRGHSASAMLDIHISIL